MSEGERQYLGDSISVEFANGCVVLVRDHSDGSEVRLRLDPLVLAEFLDWVDDNRRGELESCIERRHQHDAEVLRLTITREPR